MANIAAELRASLENSPYPHLLGFRLRELSEGYARVSVSLRPEHASFVGATDGSLIMSLADYASACCGATLGQTRVAVQFSVNFLSPCAPEGDLLAEARVIYAGKTMAVTETSVTDASGTSIARATSTSIARRERSPAIE